MINDLEAKTKGGARGDQNAKAQESSFARACGGYIAKSQRKRTGSTRRQDDDEQRPQTVRHNKPYRQSIRG